MTLFRTLAVTLAVLFAAPLAAQADTPPSALEGKAVMGQDGALLGHVERVILSANGAPAQVLVRPKGPRAGGPRSLSYKALKPDGATLAAPLTKAEFDAMPAIDPSTK